MSMTWDEMAAIEPRLTRLLEDVRTARANGADWCDRVCLWHERGSAGLLNQLKAIFNESDTLGQHEYEIAHRALVDALDI